MAIVSAVLRFNHAVTHRYYQWYDARGAKPRIHPLTPDRRNHRHTAHINRDKGTNTSIPAMRDWTSAGTAPQKARFASSEQISFFRGSVTTLPPSAATRRTAGRYLL